MRPQYFTLQELLYSRTAISDGIGNIPSFYQVEVLRRFACEVLDPIRNLWGAAVIVNSGFRSPALNKAVGGVKNSNHLCLDGNAAADITTGCKAGNKELFDLLCTSNIPFCELILENGGMWIHVSYNENYTKRKILTK